MVFNPANQIAEHEREVTEKNRKPTESFKKYIKKTVVKNS